VRFVLAERGWQSVNGFSLWDRPETREETMARVRWRPVREGNEKEDRIHNEELAARVLDDPKIDDIVMALGLLNWHLIEPSARNGRW
jgi:hypothetical protein